MKLTGFVIINIIKLSSSNKHATIFAVAKNNQKYLIFINLKKKIILAVHHFYKPIHVNDLCFVNNK